MGGKRCPHSKQKRNCAACNPCPHGKLKQGCAACNPCLHGKLKQGCAACNPCLHGKLKQGCAECNPCQHGKVKNNCMECNGCPHGKLKYFCAVCNPCPHGKRKDSCAECNPCPHGKLKRQLRAVQPLPPRKGEKELRGMQAGKTERAMNRQETIIFTTPPLIPPVSHIQRAPVKRISKHRYRGCAVSYAYHVKRGHVHDRGWIHLCGFVPSRVAASFAKRVQVVLCCFFCKRKVSVIRTAFVLCIPQTGHL